MRELRRGSDAAGQEWVVSVDSTVVRAHQDAAGAPKAPPAEVTAASLAVALQEPAVTEPDEHTGG